MMRILDEPHPTPKQWGRGTPKSPEHVEAMRKSLIGHEVSDETRVKIAEKLRSRGPSKKTCRYCAAEFMGGGNASICPECWPHHYDDRALHYRCKKYRITVEEYRRLLKEQQGKCAICGEHSSRWLCVDHDHKTDVIRGLLCESCNMAIGKMKDNPTLLETAARYLRKDVRV
jgi:hypothetical protein